MNRLKEPGIWAFNALLIFGALFAAGILSRIHEPILPAPYNVHWIVIVPITVLAELCMFSVRYRSDEQTFSLGEISYVLGVAFFPPSRFLFASAVGLFLVYRLRRAKAIRLVFNLAATTLVSSLIVVTTRAIAGQHPNEQSPRLWIAILVGCALAAAAQAILVALVRSIAERRWLFRDTPKVIFFTQLNGLAISSLGVLIAIVLGVAPPLALIGVVPVMMLYIFCRQLVKEHTLRTNVEFLYETAQSVHSTADGEKAFTSLLERSLTSFHANFGAILLFRSDAEQWLGFTVGETSSGRTSLNQAPAWFPEESTAAILQKNHGGFASHQLLDQLGSKNAMVAALRIEGELHGVILVADRGAEGPNFSELDRNLFELLAKQVAIGLENSQLERSLGVVTRLEEEMRHQANHDALTGLANRALLTAVLQRPSASTRGLLLIDLDDFKTINDTLGHAAGDEVLIEVARRLKHAVREEDLVARLGGDEFAIVLSTRGDHQRAVDAAERVSVAMEPPMMITGREVTVHASIGIAEADNISFETLLHNADVAMYEAKNAGKGHHRLFEAGMDDEARQRLQIISGLRQAISNNQFALAYQPILDLQLSMTVAVEALLRWEHHELGTLGPDRFIPLAEESGLINSLGAWALRRACRDVARLRSSSGEPLELHVNVSPQQLGTADFVDSVMSALQDSDMAAARLVLEITEKTALADSPTVKANVGELRKRGIQIALDDFGTGYSSLAAAHDFPLDLIKIDQLFIRAITANSDASLVRAILAMADSLSLVPVAEGIETHEQLEKLVELGCRFGQGYLFSPALAIDSLLEWISQSAPTTQVLTAI